MAFHLTQTSGYYQPHLITTTPPDVDPYRETTEMTPPSASATAFSDPQMAYTSECSNLILKPDANCTLQTRAPARRVVNGVSSPSLWLTHTLTAQHLPPTLHDRVCLPQAHPKDLAVIRRLTRSCWSPRPMASLRQSFRRSPSRLEDTPIRP